MRWSRSRRSARFRILNFLEDHDRYSRVATCTRNYLGEVSAHLSAKVEKHGICAFWLVAGEIAKDVGRDSGESSFDSRQLFIAIKLELIFVPSFQHLSGTRLEHFFALARCQFVRIAEPIPRLG